MPSLDKYLKCTEIIDCDDKSVKRKARSLTKGLKTDKEKAIALYYFVRDEVKHNPYAPLYDANRYKASVTLEERNGFCQQKAILLIALARSIGIPARLGFVDVYDHQLSENFKQMIGGVNKFPFHGFAELYVGGKWLHVSPAYDKGVCQRKGFVAVEFDGEHDAKDSPRNVKGEPHIEHVEYHGPYDDFPWEEVRVYYKKWLAGMGLDYDEMAKMGDQVRQQRLKSKG
jgi:transglutaminase-like putative cysteine protease